MEVVREDVTQVGLVNADAKGGLYEDWTKLPSVLNGSALAVTFLAQGPQDWLVALSPEENVASPMYEFHVGSHNNMNVALKRAVRGEVVATVPSLACAANCFNSYWVLLAGETVAFGAGDAVGKGTILTYNDPEPVAVQYLGFSSLRHPLSLKNVCAKVVPAESLGETLKDVKSNFVCVSGILDSLSEEDRATVERAVEAYRLAIEGNRARCERFKAPLIFPDVDSFFPYTLLKRIQRQPTVDKGVDVESKAEREKASRRLARFTGPAPAAATADDAEAAGGAVAGLDTSYLEGILSKEKLAKRRTKFGGALWQANMTMLGLEPKHVFIRDPDRKDYFPPAAAPQNGDAAAAAAADAEGMEMDIDDSEALAAAVVVPDKVFVHCLDKAVSGEMRDPDVRAYFQGCGPRGVEWLNDWSFVVDFADAADAAAAIEKKALVLPSPPPESVLAAIPEEQRCDVAALGYHLGEPLIKIESDRWGRKGQWGRCLLRLARKGDALTHRPKGRQRSFAGPVPPREPLPQAVIAAGGGGSDGGGGFNNGDSRRSGGGGNGAAIDDYGVRRRGRGSFVAGRSDGYLGGGGSGGGGGGFRSRGKRRMNNEEEGEDGAAAAAGGGYNGGSGRRGADGRDGGGNDGSRKKRRKGKGATGRASAPGAADDGANGAAGGGEGGSVGAAAVGDSVPAITPAEQPEQEGARRRRADSDDE